MQPIVELKNAYGAVYFRMAHDAVRHYLHCEWIGFLLHEELMEAGRKSLRWAQDHARAEGCLGVVNDCSRMRGAWDIAIEWSQETWSPAMHREGLVANAIVRSPDETNQGSADAMAETVLVDHLETRVFDSLAEAQEWFQDIHRRGFHYSRPAREGGAAQA